MTDDLDARSKQLAKYLLDALDREDDPDRLAYAIQKEREDRAALERFYVQTGQKPALGESETVVAVWDYASRPEVTFAIGVLWANGVARYAYKTLPKRNRPAAIAAAVQELAARIERLPDTGEFGPIEQALVHDDRRAVLRCAPSPADPDRMRFAELRVMSASGQSTTSQWLLAGSNGELAAYLRWPDTVEDIPRRIRELVETQQQHRMG